MALDDYTKAYKLGKKDYQARLLRGELPTLEVLDNVLQSVDTYNEASLGLVQIPLNQIVGTKTSGRSFSFSGNFMPILDEHSEFASKWSKLCTAQEEEGIRDPIIAYEYMNKFYVLEGNKRVSVLKYFGAVSVPGTVTRIIPKRTEDINNKIYFEFLDFYELSHINYIYFSKLGSFIKLQSLVGKGPNEKWSDDERMDFRSAFTRFEAQYESAGGKQLVHITTGDAFLAFINLYGYDVICNKTASELDELITNSWKEFESLYQDIDLQMAPKKEKPSLLSLLLPSATPKLKAAFIYAKTPESSAWTYSHELGRLHLEQTFPDEICTIAYNNASMENIEQLMEQAIAEGCNIIFTTSPSFVQASVKVAIAYPDIRILNCSLHTSHGYIRTYYSRMHEAKFLMGAIAGAMSENNKISYIADYPIFGTIANINAFALGAKMINPRAQIYLDWNSVKDNNIEENINRINPGCVSGKDMVVPEEGSRFYGVHKLYGNNVWNLAMPLYHWGKFYERLIRTIMNGSWKLTGSKSEDKAINYWWGMSANVIDIICSKSLPPETRKLVDLLKNSITSDFFNPFKGVLYSQNGIVQNDPNQTLSSTDIITMDWLADNIIGSIPSIDELYDHAKPVTTQQGINTEKIITAEKGV